jgi:hypothetical protein
MLLTKHFILSNSQRKKEKRNINKNGFKRELNNIGKKLKQHPDHFYLRTSFHVIVIAMQVFQI